MRYEDMRLGGYVTELARCFQSEQAVRALLIDADLDPTDLPPFNQAPRVYWTNACAEIARGAGSADRERGRRRRSNDFVRILTAAAIRYPGNELFSAFRPDDDRQRRALRVLFVGALPAGSHLLRIDAEFQSIQDQLRDGKLPHAPEVISRFAASADNLLASALSAAPDLLHYAGHGQRDGALVLETPAQASVGRDVEALDTPAQASASVTEAVGRPGQASASVAAEVVGRLLRAIESKIRCVILNACYSAEAAGALVAHTDIVIGTTAAIEDRSALAFAHGFYAGLAHRTSVGAAVELGRVQMDLQKVPGTALVTLHARAGVDPNNVFLT